MCGISNVRLSVVGDATAGRGSSRHHKRSLAMSCIHRPPETRPDQAVGAGSPRNGAAVTRAKRVVRRVSRK